MPPRKRLWRAALVAPFAANTALVLHKCPADNGAGVKYLVQALHNEKPVVMPVSVILHQFKHCFFDFIDYLESKLCILYSVLSSFIL